MTIVTESQNTVSKYKDKFTKSLIFDVKTTDINIGSDGKK